MITSPHWLYAPYLLNILILVPVCYSLFFGNGVSAIFEGTVEPSSGLGLLVASLWLSILIASVAGLLWPAFFAPVILIQIIYKSVWLLTFILPLIMAGKAYPAGISVCFILIIITYPVFFWLATR